MKALLLIAALTATGVEYPVLYLEQPHTAVPEFGEAERVDHWVAGTKLRRIDPNGTITTLVDPGAGAVLAYHVSFDAKRIVYSEMQPGVGARLFVWPEKRQITDNAWLQYETSKWPIVDLGPCWVDDEWIVFSTNRNGYRQPKVVEPVYQLFAVKADGSRLRQLGFMNVAGAIDAYPTMNGDVLFSSLESQGWRPDRWGIWRLQLGKSRDGNVHVIGFGPVFSPLTATQVSILQHFNTQLSNGQVAIGDYYGSDGDKQKTYGLGAATVFHYPPVFGSPDAKHASNPPIRYGLVTNRDGKPSHFSLKSYPYQPAGLFNITPECSGADIPAAFKNGKHVGRVGHPAAGPGNDLLLTWSGGIVQATVQQPLAPNLNCGIGVIKGGTVLEDTSQLAMIVDDPTKHEFRPGAMVPYSAIYGIERPAIPEVEAPTEPFGYVATSNVKRGEVQSVNLGTAWGGQGSTANAYDPDKIAHLRVIIQEPTPADDAPFYRMAGNGTERMKILADIPVPKSGGPIAFRMVANQAFTLALLDENENQVAFAQTWRHVPPGAKLDCGGCHNHWKPEPAVDWSTLDILDITQNKPHSRVFERDVRPILSRCITKCHGKDSKQNFDLPPERLVNHRDRKGNSLVTPFVSADSTLVQALLSGSMPPPESGVTITRDEIRAIAEWIDLGAAYGQGGNEDYTPPVGIPPFADYGGIDRVEGGKVFDLAGNWSPVEETPTTPTDRPTIDDAIKSAEEHLDLLKAVKAAEGAK